MPMAMTSQLTKQRLSFLLSRQHLLSEAELKLLARSMKVIGPQIEDEEVEAEAARLRGSFQEYFQAAWSVIETQPLVMGFHLRLMCDYLQELYTGDKFTDLLINIPPGCSKSVCVSVIWPSWVWANDATATFMGISYSQRLAERDAMKTRMLITSSWYQRLFGKTVQPGELDQRRMYSLSAGGWRLSTTPLGSATGDHPRYIIVDDPINAGNSESKKKRPAVNEWWDGTMTSRGASLGRRVVGVMQRFHEMDWSGHFLKTTEDVAHVCIPMRYEPGRMKDIGLGTDPRIEPGQLLDPVRFTEKTVKKLERGLGVYGTAGQLQQRPTPKGSAKFKLDAIHLITADQVPMSKIVRFKRAWDRAGTEDDGDYSVGTLGGITGGEVPKLFVYGMVRGQWGTDEVLDQMALWSKLDERQFGFSKFETVFERGASDAGIQAAKETIRRLKGRRVRAIKPVGNKEVRAEPLANAIAAGEVYFVDGPWVRECMDEMRYFPKGEHDDQVDSLSLLYSELIGGSLFEDAIDDEPEERLPCANPACDRLADAETDHCCDSCRVAETNGDRLKNEGHCPECAYRHSQLFASGEWEPAQPINQSIRDRD